MVFLNFKNNIRMWTIETVVDNHAQHTASLHHTGSESTYAACEVTHESLPNWPPLAVIGLGLGLGLGEAASPFVSLE